MKNSATIIPVSGAECQIISWKSHLKSAFSDSVQLLNYLQISASQFEPQLLPDPDFPIRVPIPFADKMEKGNINDPLLLQVLATKSEELIVKGFSQDPLDEQRNEIPGLLHKYAGRVLLILTATCAVNCRYCFRRHFPYNQQVASGESLTRIINYIRGDQSISEVILSGGDPLLMSDEQLSLLIVQLEDIPHLSRVRIHTRLPVVIPQRLTSKLVQVLSISRLQISMVIHANHANELDEELGLALANLSKSGVCVFNQSVLLRGINDDHLTLAALSEKLFKYQIVPYYIHLLDPVAGASHFDIDKEAAIQIMSRLRDRLPGYLVPRLAKEESHKRSKTILA